MNYWNPAAIQDHSDHPRGVMSDIWAFIIHDTDGREGGDLEIFRHGRGDTPISIQFYITQKGALYQFMPANVGANHAGVSHMPDGRTGLNDHTIGIELENYPEGSPYSEAMLKQLDNLIHWLDLTFGPKPIYGHCDVAPGRKDDPNAPFPMSNYKKYRTHTGEVFQTERYFIIDEPYSTEEQRKAFNKAMDALNKAHTTAVGFAPYGYFRTHVAQSQSNGVWNALSAAGGHGGISVETTKDSWRSWPKEG